MMQAFFFGPAERALFGGLHAAPASTSGSLLICAPLFQEGVRLHRALWVLAESLAASGIETLRFDWSGSGDSDGDAASTTFDAWLNDFRIAEAALRGPGVGRLRVLAPRSAALPVLAQIERAAGQPVDLVLWDPCLHGAGIISEWRRLDQVQFDGAGRYTQGHPTPVKNELCGFDVPSALTASLEATDARVQVLPAGSRVLLAVWEIAPFEKFIAANRDAGNLVDVLMLDETDRPGWEDASMIESQIFPRRSVSAIAQKIAGDRA